MKQSLGGENQANFIVTQSPHPFPLPRAIDCHSSLMFCFLYSLQYFVALWECEKNIMEVLIISACVVFTKTEAMEMSARCAQRFFFHFSGIDYGQPWRRTFGENIVYTDWKRDNYYHAVQQLVGDAKTVGLEYDWVHLDSYRKFTDALPNAKFVDVSQSTMKMRMIKSPEEIELIKQGARIADLGGEAVVKAIKEGASEHEIALASTNAMVREIADTYPHSEIRDTWTWFQSGINTDGAHNPVTTRRLRKGDILSLNCFPMIAGYYTALERTLFCDHVPTDRHMELWEVNCKVHRRGLELIKPGARCSDIANELNELYLEHDLLKYRTFGYGHSFGVLSHYYGREAGLEIREDIETMLQPNMVISMEPMITIPEREPGAGGYREHDILVVKETASENITKFPYGPEHNIIKN